MNVALAEGERFDDLTRLLAANPSWRTVFKDLAATATTGLVALFSTKSALAADPGTGPSLGGPVDHHCRPILAHCHDFRQCCSGICLDILKICL